MIKQVVVAGNLGPEFDVNAQAGKIRMLPRFVFATRTLNLPLAAGLDIVWQQAAAGSNITLTTAGIFTLEAGFAYELEATIALATGGGTTAACNFTWVDAVTNAQLAKSAQGHPLASVVAGTRGQQSSQGTAKLIYVPIVQQQVKVRILSVNGTPPLQAATSYAAIKALH